MGNRNRYDNRQNYNQRNNNRSGYGQQNNNQSKPNYKKVTQELSKEYSNPVDVYLPEGKAYRYANDFRDIPTHQMRKILNGAKEAVLAANAGELEDAKKKMFILVAMTAYNAGRISALKGLSDFVESTINQQSIVNREDILAFDQLFTSIVAYHTKLKGQGED